MPKVEWKVSPFKIADLLKFVVTARIDTLPDESDPVVLQYAELMREGVPMALPRVIKADNGTPYLVDGHHRVLAAQLNGESMMECEWELGTKLDALNCACAANREHGKPRTHRDIRNAVQLMRKTFPSYTHARIAREVGCSTKTVQRALTDPEKAKKAQNEVDRCPHSFTQSENEDHSEPIEPEEHPHVTAGLPQSDYKDQAGPPEHVMDELDQEVPVHLITFWKRRGELQGLRARLREVLSRFKRGNEEGDRLYTSIPAERALADLCNAERMIGDSIPYALCPTCSGLVLEGCTMCGETGFVNEATAK